MQIRTALKRAMWDHRIAKETHNRQRVAETRAFIRTYFPHRNKRHVIIY